MTGARRCSGHHFIALTFGALPLTKWRCVNCGLRVRGTAVARQLEGLRS